MAENKNEPKQKIILETPVELVDSPVLDTSNSNLTPISLEELEAMDGVERHYDIQERSFNALRYEKASETRKGRTKYKKGVQNAVQALLNGTYCSLTDGTQISGAEIIAINLFERAMDRDESAKLLLKVSGDLNDKEEQTNSYEEFIKNVGSQF